MSLLTCFLIAVCVGGVEMDSSKYDHIKSITQAVLDSYDVNKTFHENFYTLLHIICPYSVQCDDFGHTTELNFNYLESGWNDTVYLSDELFKARKTSSMNEARSYLKASFSNISNCCNKCYCSGQCRENTCCPFDNTGRRTNKAKTLRKQHCILPTLPVYRKSQGTTVYMITDCSNTSVDEETLRKCQHPNTRDFPDEVIPVYSKTTDVIYKNKYCALCNNEIPVSVSKLVVEFIDGLALAGPQHFPNSSQTLFQVGSTTSFIKFLTDFPDELSERKEEFICYKPISHKYTHCADQKILNKDQANFYQEACSYFESSYLKYNNVFCLLCSIKDLNKYTSSCSTERHTSTVNSFTAFMVSRDPPPADDVTAMASQSPHCTCEEYYYEEKETCRQVICPPDKDFSQCSCEPFLEHITGFHVLIFVELFPQTPSSRVTKLLNSTPPETIANRIRSEMNKYFREKWGSMDMIHIAMYQETSLTDRNHVKFHTLLQIRSKLYVDNILLLNTVYELLNSGTELIILKTPMRMRFGRIGDISRTGDGYKMYAVNYTSADINSLSFSKIADVTGKLSVGYIKLAAYQHLKKLLFCKRIRLNGEEMSGVHSSALKAGYSLDKLPYFLEVSKQQMCLDDFINIFVKPNSASFTCLPFYTTFVLAIVIINNVSLY